MKPEIIRIKVRALHEFASAAINNPKYAKVTPISRSRALAYANNPHAGDDDVGLLVALLDNECVGYLGIMPGLLKTAAGVTKVYWFCTFFVERSYRQKGCGAALIKEAFGLGYDFVVSSMSAQSDRAFRKAGMREFGTLSYYALDLRRLNPASLVFRLFRSLMRRAGFELRFLTRAARACDKLLLPPLSSCFYAALAPALKKQTTLIRWFSQQPAIETNIARADSGQACAFIRNNKTLSWMLAFPWTVAKKNAAADDASYFFTAMTESSDFELMSSKASGFMLLSCSLSAGHRVVRLLDSSASSDAAAAMLLRHARARRAWGLECSRDIGLSLRRILLMRLCLKARQRHYLFYPAGPDSPLSRASNCIRLDYCDGENPFA